MQGAAVSMIALSVISTGGSSDDSTESVPLTPITLWSASGIGEIDCLSGLNFALPSLKHSDSSSLPPSLTHSLTTHSLTPSLPRSLTHVLTPSLALPFFLAPYNPSWLAPSLPHSNPSSRNHTSYL